MSDEFYMSLALNEAWKFQGLTYPNPAVGCVILDKFGKILSIAAHQKAGCGHAELNGVALALKKINPNLIFPKNPNEIYNFILENHNNLLKGSKAFVTLEPCSHIGKTPPCAKLLVALKFSEVIIGYKDENKIAKGGAEILKRSNICVKFGVLEDKCKELIEPFLSWQNGNFSFLKLGASLNGVLKGGVITNLESRQMTHKFRSLIDLLVIGGNTVRIDRPRLDTRLINGTKNPDIFIYSKSKNFDKTIPLFEVRDRKILIQSDINLVKNYKFCMFEGGENLIKNLPPFVTHILIFFSEKFINLENLSINLNLKLLFMDKISDNFYGWFKILR
ncbi:bifunctional diaminohydroxyphosphoribosylaminopyrimidine deaminase/5-amino-6-(5-phosphoribosylamino)uracil reductase RibD [Campylobacter sp. FMV-PI01]|uniref:Riboflavin biosynthesis protein RibD n=1 Tax=Campylobacter portucalensis TaxID=2608384 RepID=A0A6L5WMJ0_9BACT|nr:bifunctional diaminohydroxyphosphoribosylaminopyrimidine deaminase/5-amino-6-(5-phosphoribosylamino)uracil reductase RibD [Campylobacter portucalensis]MSN96871.1 bifunctional diaminohydroxyphosphoribosylaminopyrimidine deaminase/5-amino-6-(5-phosphoribosylamino)uracil reductase RibD [Campylobacter portucalensis]